ncbi:MAG: hypothetical protein QOD42_3325 [Sphingomonadales bacterium]|jgi:hypothetical protein|nr:hypothetical protein [Sphingomonadales bacterium]
MVWFFLVALAIMALFLGLGGGWLLPALGVEGVAARVVSGGLAGMIIAIVYLQMFKRPSGA